MGAGGFSSLAAENADMVFSCVGNDDDVRQVLLGEDGVLQRLSGGIAGLVHRNFRECASRHKSMRD